VRVVRCAGAHDFLDRARSFLLADEACHNLLLGVAAAVAARGDGAAPEPYFAVAYAGGEIAAAGMMTRPHPLVVSKTQHMEAASLIARDLHAAGISALAVHGPEPAGRRFAETWQELTGRHPTLTMRQRIYRLEHVRAAGAIPGRLRHATRADRAVLVAWVRAFSAEAFGDHAPPVDAEEIVDRRLRTATDGFCFWDDGGPRTLTGYAGPTPHGIRVGFVYTPPEHRRRGYAGVCVAAVSRLLLERGYRYCFLYADLANPTSNRIYQRIGYEPVCDVDEYRFVETRPTL